MIIKENFLAPSYYKKFSCKCGDCRHTCCNGLTINISQDEYFKLVGLDCSPELRSELDLALKPRTNPDPYKYAQICPSFFGSCRMLMDNGRCHIQYECGEEALNAVCKYFPRSPRFNISPRVSTSGGCEHTLELLVGENNDSISFDHSEMTFNLSAREDINDQFQADELQDIQNQLFSALLSNEASIDDSICEVPKILGCSMSSSPSISALVRLTAFAAVQFDNMADICEPVARMSLGRSFLPDDYNDVEIPDPAHLTALLHEQYDQLLQSFPQLDNWLRRFFVNEIFYNQIPYSDTNITLSQSGLLLESELRMLQMLLSANVNNISSQDDLIDICMFFFRMTDFTPFAHNALLIL